MALMGGQVFSREGATTHRRGAHRSGETRFLVPARVRIVGVSPLTRGQEYVDDLLLVIDKISAGISHRSMQFPSCTKSTHQVVVGTNFLVDFVAGTSILTFMGRSVTDVAFYFRIFRSQVRKRSRNCHLGFRFCVAEGRKILLILSMIGSSVPRMGSKAPESTDSRVEVGSFAKKQAGILVKRSSVSGPFRRGEMPPGDQKTGSPGRREVVPGRVFPYTCAFAQASAVDLRRRFFTHSSRSSKR